MTRVYTLDGRAFDVDESLLAKNRIAPEKVAGLMQNDSLPDAPPVGEYPERGIPPHILESMQREGMELPIPAEARQFVRARAFADGTIVIDVRLPQTMGGPMGQGGAGGPAGGGPSFPPDSR